METPNERTVARLMEQLNEIGPEGMTAMLNLAMRLERERHAGAQARALARAQRQAQSEVAREHLEASLPEKAEIILVDENLWGALPFPERDGVYWPPPADGHAKLAELERRRRAGRQFVVFAQLAFWWLDNYAELRDHLERNCKLRLQTRSGYDVRDADVGSLGLH
jgi:hypothetical protein